MSGTGLARFCPVFANRTENDPDLPGLEPELDERRRTALGRSVI